MKKKILIITLGLLGAFFVGSLAGIGYFYFTDGVNVVSATPMATPPPAKTITPEEGNIVDNIEQDSPKEIDQSIVPKDELGMENETEEQTAEEGFELEKEINEEMGLSSEEGEKVAYITIDDGPDAKNTPAILAILDEYDIKATFFVLGTSVEKNPEVLTQIKEAGHTIGNHTYNHIYKETYASDESFWKSVKKTEELVANITGFRPMLIREPGGRFLSMPEKQQMVREEGYGLIHWNIDSYDSRSPIPDAKTIFSNVQRQAEKAHLWPAMVMLFHDGGGHKSTVEALPTIIEYLMDEGFSFKTIEEMDAKTMANLPRP